VLKRSRAAPWWRSDFSSRTLQPGRSVARVQLGGFVICATCVHLLAEYDITEKNRVLAVYKLFEALKRSSAPDYRRLASLADQASADLTSLADQFERHRESHAKESAIGAGA